MYERHTRADDGKQVLDEWMMKAGRLQARRRGFRKATLVRFGVGSITSVSTSVIATSVSVSARRVLLPLAQQSPTWCEDTCITIHDSG
jgi:hypothetical protein